VLELADGFMNIRMGQVGALLFEKLSVTPGAQRRGQLLERTDVEIAIVEKSLELRHVTGQKAPVLADTVAADG